jgi:hypothetical protein
MLDGKPGDVTFGLERYLNQELYHSRLWKEDIKPKIILRDHGCDLAHLDHEIVGQRIYIHHLNPITIDDVENKSEFVTDPEFLITTILDTHNAIHYGDDSFLMRGELVERRPNDTCPWR